MSLAAHTIKSANGSRRGVKRRGRGNASGHGNYSCRGGKGQTARSGGQRGLRLKAFKNLMQQTPKLRGFKSMYFKPTVVRLTDLEKNFTAGAPVTLAILKEKKVIGKNIDCVKIVNTGEITKAMNLTGIEVTAGAKAKIEKAGGSVK